MSDTDKLILEGRPSMGYDDHGRAESLWLDEMINVLEAVEQAFTWIDTDHHMRVRVTIEVIP